MSVLGAVFVVNTGGELWCGVSKFVRILVFVWVSWRIFLGDGEIYRWCRCERFSAQWRMLVFVSVRRRMLVFVCVW